jgi:hypothetical protein
MGPMHKRLIGTWKSDKRETLRTFAAYKRMPRGRKKRQLAAILGKLRLRYTPKFCFVTFDGKTSRERYEVIAEDHDSIVIRVYAEQRKRQIDPMILNGLEELFAPKLQQLNFESQRGQDCYWVGVRVFVEWFKRERPTDRMGSRNYGE